MLSNSRASHQKYKCFCYCLTRTCALSSSSVELDCVVVGVGGSSLFVELGGCRIYSGGVLPLTHSSVMITVLTSEPGTSNIASRRSFSCEHKLKGNSLNFVRLPIAAVI